MSDWVLRLTEDRPTARGQRLGPLNRVLYVREGAVTVAIGGGQARVTANAAWHGAGACTVTAEAVGATVLRYELARADAPAVAGEGSRVLLEHPIDLAPGDAYLMRCDRVDFAPGGVALPHRHRGGGIRCLIAGTIELRIGDEPPRTLRPGQAWFESGREPVRADADPALPTSFIRCSILPRAIRGQSSIMYVDPADAAGGRPRHYTVFVDEPIALS
jgi:quercetin dioxygenase-like cupin family protein